MITQIRVARICSLALPLTVALGSNLIMAVIDLAMVGKLGNDSIAAVALASFTNMLMVAFLGGIAPAVQGLVSRNIGEGDTVPRALPLNAGLYVALLVGLPVTFIACFFCPLFISWISSGPEVTRIAVLFLKTLSIAIVGSGMMLSFRGYWASIEKPRVYMLIGLFADLLNIAINYVLIFGHFGAPALGARGAAIGTASAVYAGLLINVAIGCLRFRRVGFLSVWPDWSWVTRILKLGLPATMQEFLFSAGYLVFFSMLARVGTNELAAANVLIRLTMVLIVLAMALGMASATLVSKSAGEGDIPGAAAWGWDTGKVGVIGITLLGLPLLVFPRFFLSGFLSDPQTISMAVLPLQLTAATTGLVSLIYIFAFTLFSVGDGNRVMMISFSTQWLFFLPAVWLVGPYLHYGFLPIWLVHVAYGGIATVLITAIWAGGRWKRIRI